ncbi:MAG: S-methyl-5-thioribose-1-phosphate isomerase [Fimbriimonadaceae bacterium]|nr:MAG: S-methyl-5-thioribose-1-phosphate isomerase [Fimbriimonadaceae bacterium]
MPSQLRALYFEDGVLSLLDQRLLPAQEVWLGLSTSDHVVEAIREMAVRGAPAIGVAAAYGMVLAVQNGEDWKVARDKLAGSRPTAVNLFWALDRLDKLTDKSVESVLAEAKAIEQEDLAMNHKIGEFGESLVPENATILTICNTGSLATSGHGTALGIIRTAHTQGKVKHVYSCETRPRQQGLRLTAYELMHDQIPFHSIADSAAASLMAAGKIDFVVAGADRIAANGDTANKIGTLMLAVLANHYNIPFVIAAPSSTLDPSLPDGSHIPIEERHSSELTHAEELQIAPEGTPVFNPGFDVTPGTLITAIVTENGINRQPYGFK